jgi:hypothetical protein
MIASAAGEMNAAPRPWRLREAISIPELDERPSSSEATVKTTTPKRKRRLRPSRSPGAAAEQRSRRRRGVWRYDPLEVLLGHVQVGLDRGSATFTTVASSTTMNCAKQMRTRTTQGFVARLI